MICDMMVQDRDLKLTDLYIPNRSFQGKEGHDGSILTGALHTWIENE